MMINLKTNKMSDLNNGGLVYETSNNNDVYVEIKPDALLVRRIKGKHADELIEKLDEYIEYYNTKRIKVKLKGLTPIEYRNQALQAA